MFNNYPYVFILKGGVRVYLEDTSWGLVKLRVEGESLTFWTVCEAIGK